MIRGGTISFLKKSLFRIHRHQVCFHILQKSSKFLEKSSFSDQDVNFDCRKTQRVQPPPPPPPPRGKHPDSS